MVGDGLAGFGEVLQALPGGSAKVNVKRIFNDGDYIFSHTEYDFFGPKVGFDIFRFENGLIVEHWDNLQVLVSKTLSGRSQMDGSVELNDLDKTENNKALVRLFVNDILIAGNVNKIKNYISESTYAQHNPNVEDGLDGIDKALAAMAEAGMPMTYTNNHLILGEGNFVLAVSEGVFLGKHSSFYDLFRLQDNKIVEHWDAIEEIPSRADWKNANGKFGFPQSFCNINISENCITA